ncbi:MAG: hypothetical protein HY554_02790 [Elusimicrobia bacterium]|nr:hypothetical protein [Elusimicrobiota bacterium]
MAQIIPAVLVAAALLLPPVSPAEAADVAADAAVTVFDLKETGASQNRAREYDGRREGAGIEGDVSVRSAFGKALVEAEGTRLNSGSDSAMLDLLAGPWVRLSGSLDLLRHRQAMTQNGNVFDSSWVGHAVASDRWASVRDWVPDFGGDTRHLGFKREETAGKLSLRDQRSPVWVTLGWWREAERGARAHYWYVNSDNNVGPQSINRYTRELSAAVESRIGENGYAGYAAETRKFSDAASTLMDTRTSGVYGALPRNMLNWVSEQAVLKHTLSGSYRFSPSLTVAAGASTRNRKHYLTQYSMTANSAHLGASYRPSKDWALSSRLYARATKTNENTGSPQYRMTGTDAGADAVDYYSYQGDFKARYTGFKNVALSLGYKPQHTFRRNAGSFIETATFADAAVHQDGVAFLGGQRTNPTEATDTRQTVKADADFALPNDAELSVGAVEMRADRGGYQAMPTRRSDQTLSLTLPVTRQVQVIGMGGLTYAANTKASFARFKRRTAWTQFGGQWTDAEDRGSLGAYYGYENARDTFDAFWGDATTTPGNAPIVHVLVPAKYTNHTVSATGDAKLPKGFGLDGNVTYGLSEGHNPMNPADFRLEGGAQLTDYNPTDIRTMTWGAGLSYAPIKDVSARLGYSQDIYYNNYLTDDNGQARVVSLTASAKF